MDMVTMTKKDSFRNIKESTLEDETNNLFIQLRTCYNKGSNEIKSTIQYQCMSIILESLEKESDIKQLKEVFDKLTLEQ